MLNPDKKVPETVYEWLTSATIDEMPERLMSILFDLCQEGVPSDDTLRAYLLSKPWTEQDEVVVEVEGLKVKLEGKPVALDSTDTGLYLMNGRVAFVNRKYTSLVDTTKTHGTTRPITVYWVKSGMMTLSWDADTDCQPISIVEDPEWHYNESCTLQESPCGLFLADQGGLGLMTDYRMNVGQNDDVRVAFELTAGAFFWGGTNSHAERAKLALKPIY